MADQTEYEDAVVSFTDAFSRDCRQVISSNYCPLRHTGCQIQGKRVRILQQISNDSALDTDWMPSAKQDSTQPSFLDLPREIRDLIYEQALVSNHTKRLNLGKVFLNAESGTSHWHRPNTPRSTDWLSLLWTSKQLHHEAAAAFYTYTPLEVTISDGTTHADLESMARRLADFGREGIIPLHPGYLRFVKDITFNFRARGVGAWPLPSLYQMLPSPPSSPKLSPEEISSRTAEVLARAQYHLTTSTHCHCLRIVDLGGGWHTCRRTSKGRAVHDRYITPCNPAPFAPPAEVIEQRRRDRLEEMGLDPGFEQTWLERLMGWPGSRERTYLINGQRVSRDGALAMAFD